MTVIKKYICIVKVGEARFLRYHVNDLIRFTEFLDKQFSDWRWFNVYSNSKVQKRSQVASFTRNRRPDKRFVDI